MRNIGIIKDRVQKLINSMMFMLAKCDDIMADTSAQYAVSMCNDAEHASSPSR